MTVDEAMQRLEADLGAGDVRVRREAVDFAAKLLKERACREECRQRIVSLLENAAAKDLPTVQDRARTVLDNLRDGGDPTWTADDRKHMVRVPCKQCGHMNYYDRRQVCRDARPFYRTLVRAANGEELSEITEVCTACGNHEIKFRVNCRGY